MPFETRVYTHEWILASYMALIRIKGIGDYLKGDLRMLFMKIYYK